MLGDNIDTAISVARECNMVDQGHKVIMLQATDNGGDQGLSLSYTVVGDTGGLEDLYSESCAEVCNDSMNVQHMFSVHVCFCTCVSVCVHVTCMRVCTYVCVLCMCVQHSLVIGEPTNLKVVGLIPTVATSMLLFP